jgi:chromosomal replication initiation ATPase DnaA
MILLADIKAATAEVFGVSMKEMVAPRRTRRIAVARQFGMYLARDITQRPYRMIAETFGRTDHATSIHGVRKVASALEAGNETTQVIVTAIREAAHARAEARRGPLLLTYTPPQIGDSNAACN